MSSDLALNAPGVSGDLSATGLSAQFGSDGAVAIALYAPPATYFDPSFPAFPITGTVSASGSIRAAYQIEYLLPGAVMGTTQSIHMNAGDTLSASGAPLDASSHLVVIDSAYSSLTPPVMTPPPPSGSPPPSGPPPGSPPPSTPPGVSVYDQSDCIGSALLGCFGGAPLSGADFSILVNEPYDVIMTVALTMPNETGLTVSGSASIDPGFTPVNPAPGGFFFTSPAAAPEPSAWLLLMVGVGLVGASVRRHNRIYSQAV